MIAFLICATNEAGEGEARERGWTRIAATRYATPEKDDIRVITRADDLVLPNGAAATMIKGRDYDSGPPEAHGERATLIWERQRAEFQHVVDNGRGRWVDFP